MNRIEVARVSSQEFERVALHEFIRIVLAPHHVDADDFGKAGAIIADRRPPAPQ